MAPPKFDLSSKEFQKQQEAEASETKVPMEEPAIVTVTREKRPKCQRQRKMRGCILCFAVAIAIAIAVVAVIFTVKHVIRMNRPKNFYCRVSLPHQSVPENVDVDHDNQLIRVQTPRTDTHHGMEILHDYTAKIMAFKDVTNLRCYIDTINSTFDDDYNRWYRLNGNEEVPEPRYLKATDWISPEVLSKFGEHISAHCNGVETLWVVAVTREQTSDGTWQENVIRMVYSFDLNIKINIWTQPKTPAPPTPVF